VAQRRRSSSARHSLITAAVGDQVRTGGEETANRVVVETSSWAVGTAGLLTALAGVVMFLVLTGAITRAVAAEVAGKDPSLEKSYRFGFHRFLSVLLVSVLVGVLLYLDLRARKERLTMEALGADLQASATPATHHQRTRLVDHLPIGMSVACPKFGR
jgi:hypothetical protein